MFWTYCTPNRSTRLFTYLHENHFHDEVNQTQLTIHMNYISTKYGWIQVHELKYIEWWKSSNYLSQFLQIFKKKFNITLLFLIQRKVLPNARWNSLIWDSTIYYYFDSYWFIVNNLSIWNEKTFRKLKYILSYFGRRFFTYFKTSERPFLHKNSNDFEKLFFFYKNRAYMLFINFEFTMRKSIKHRKIT